MTVLPTWARCPELFAVTGPRCELMKDHGGPHNAAVIWGDNFAADDSPTLKLPPIRDSIGQRRRPPAPSIEDLSDRAELIEALGRELQRELRELREDQGDDSAACGAISPRSPDGVEWVCGREPGHGGSHEVHGRVWS